MKTNIETEANMENNTAALADGGTSASTNNQMPSNRTSDLQSEIAEGQYAASPEADDAVNPSDEKLSDSLKRLLAAEREDVAEHDPYVQFKCAGRNYAVPQIEAALLSMCMNKPDMLDPVIQAIQAGDIYAKDHVEVFKAILYVYTSGASVNPQKVRDHLVNLAIRENEEVKWIQVVNTLKTAEFNAEDAGKYLQELREAAGIRGGRTYCPERYSEDFTAQLFRARLGKVRCVGSTWYRYAEGVWKASKADEYRKMAQNAIHPRYREGRRTMEVLNHAEILLQDTACRWHGAYQLTDEGAVMVNASNCIVRIASDGKVDTIDHSPEWNFTMKLDTPYCASASARGFLEKLEEILPDPKDRELLQVFCGSILYPSCKFETALVAYGPGGTGKTTIADVIKAVLGIDLAVSIGLEELCKSNSYSLPGLKWKMLNVGSELTGTEVAESANFKKLVSGEAMHVRQIYGSPTEMKSTCKMIFLTNIAPKFRGGTDAEARRLRILPFDQKPKVVDTNLKEALMRERQGILVWMVQGLVKLLQTGEIPKGGDEAQRVLHSFDRGNDPVGSFLRECCYFSPDVYVVKKDLYEKFREWCDENGQPADRLENFFWKTLMARHPHLRSSRRTFETLRLHCLVGINVNEPILVDDIAQQKHEVSGVKVRSNVKTPAAEKFLKQLAEKRARGE